MDLQLYMRVIWRFKYLFAVGFVIAFGLAFLSLFKVSPGKKPMIAYRTLPTWSAKETLLVTQRGFPWGSSSKLDSSNPASYSQLATIYVQLVMSDQVRTLIARKWPLDMKHDVIQAAPVLLQAWNGNSPPLPLISVEVTSTTSVRAFQLAQHAAAAFRQYIGDQQAKNAIPVDQRVVVRVVRSFDPPTLVKGHSKTLPMVIFVTVMMGFLGMALVLENLRPRARAVAVEEAPPTAAAVRRTA